MIMVALEKQKPLKTQVVAKALMNVKDELALSSAVVGKIIGADASTISRINKTKDMKDNKALEASTLLIRVYRSLYAMVGGSSEAMQHWISTPNYDFNERSPVNVMTSTVGLVEVVQYLDAMRGQS